MDVAIDEEIEQTRKKVIVKRKANVTEDISLGGKRVARIKE